VLERSVATLPDRSWCVEPSLQSPWL